MHLITWEAALLHSCCNSGVEKLQNSSCRKWGFFSTTSHELCPSLLSFLVLWLRSAAVMQINTWIPETTDSYSNSIKLALLVYSLLMTYIEEVVCPFILRPKQEERMQWHWKIVSAQLWILKWTEDKPVGLPAAQRCLGESDSWWIRRSAGCVGATHRLHKLRHVECSSDCKTMK